MTLRKRLRMTLDFEVVIEDLADERPREYHRQSSSDDEELTRENLRRQGRLLRELLDDEEALRRFLTYVVVNEVDPTLDGRLGAVFGVAGAHVEEEILGPVFARLAEEDAQYFREVYVEGLLSESATALDSSFVVKWLSGSLEEIRVVTEGVFEGGGIS